MKPELSAERLKELFTYKDGKLISNMKVKSRNVGDVLGTVGAKGYLTVRVDGVSYLLHRVVYAMHHEVLPEFLDHIDGNILNNRIENLRPADARENQWNQKLNSRNTSGVKGVYFDKSRNKWNARLKVAKRVCNIGYFEKIDDAAQAIALFREKQHKEYARHA